MSELFDKRLLFVTGKGGVGKSTVASALGLAGVRRGKRVIVCELARQERMSRTFRREGVGFEETELAPGLAAISIDPQRALEEYLRIQLGNRALVRLLFENRVFQYFAAAAPGVRELVSIGKAWELARLDRPAARGRARYDLVIVDAAATGHGLGFLKAPSTVRDIARVGPIRRQADRIDGFVRDARRTGVVTVATPEEMPVSETLEFRDRLRDEMEMQMDVVVLNALYPERFAADEARRLAQLDGTPRDARVAAAVRAALSEHTRARSQRAQLRRLRGAFDPVVTLPFLFDPELELEQIERLSRDLERRL